MQKPDAYYRLIVPARLIARGIAPTKENIEIEIAYLKDRDRTSN